MIIRDKRAVHWVADNDEIHLDVRPVLEAGGEPYAIIMDVVGQLKREHGLSLHVLFNPIPLVKQLERMDYTCVSSMVEDDHWVLRIDPKA